MNVLPIEYDAVVNKVENDPYLMERTNAWFCLLPQDEQDYLSFIYIDDHRQAFLDHLRFDLFYNLIHKPKGEPNGPQV